jgi:hypothetical protein
MIPSTIFIYRYYFLVVMEKRKFIIGSILGLATMLVLSAASEIIGLGIFITIIFALLALPFAISALLVAIGTRPSEATIFAIITQILAVIAIVITVLDAMARLELYAGTMAIGFTAVLLLHMEMTRMQRRIRRKKSIEAKAKEDEMQRKHEEQRAYVPEVPKKKEKPTGKFIASKDAVQSIVHRSNCRIAKRIKPRNRERFETYSEALQKGYVPCKICLQNGE